MAGKVSSEFKEAFGRLLVLLSTALTLESSLRYSEVLLTYTKAGLITEGKFDEDYKVIFDRAIKSYMDALACYSVSGRPGWVKEQILRYCFEINYYIMPIALLEGILVLNQDSFNMTTMFNAEAVKSPGEK